MRRTTTILPHRGEIVVVDHCVGCRAMNVTVYVLEFSGGHRYVGMTSDLDRRLQEHRRRQSPSTRRFEGEPVVVYTREFASHQEARVHEKFMKSGAGRRLIA